MQLFQYHLELCMDRCNKSINGSIPNSQPSNLIPIVTPRSSYTYLNFGCWNCEPLHNGIQQNIQVRVSFHHKQNLTPLNKVKRSGGMLYNSLLLCYLSMCSYVRSDSLPGGRKFLQHLHPSVKCFKASIAQAPHPSSDSSIRRRYYNPLRWMSSWLGRNPAQPDLIDHVAAIQRTLQEWPLILAVSAHWGVTS